MKKYTENIELGLTIMATLTVIILGIGVGFFPEESTQIANDIFAYMIKYLGSGYLFVTFIAFSILIWLMFSKYGNIKFGEGKPEFSKPKFFAMMVCAGLGSGTLYWCFIESIYYYTSPPYGVEPMSYLAGEWSLAYTFMHWGPSAWSIFTIGALPICVSYYINKNKTLKLSEVCQVASKKPIKKPIKIVIDIVFYFATIATASMSLGLSIEPIAMCLEELFNVDAGVYMSIGIIGIIAIIFIVSSYTGLKNGMSKISDASIYISIVFISIIFLVGPKLFTVDMITNSVGLLVNEFFRMSFYTDPIAQSGFPQDWTVFYFAYWIVYTPAVGVFIARISKGHKLKDIIIMTIVAGSIGSIFMHGVLQSYTLNLEITGALDASGMILAGEDSRLVLEVLKTLPFSKIMIVIYVVIAILLMATTLDGCAYSLTSVSSKKLDEDGNPPKKFKLYWCMLLTVFPLVLTIIEAPINTIKSIALIIGTPITIILIVMNYGALKTIVSKFKNMSSEEIEENSN